MSLNGAVLRNLRLILGDADVKRIEQNARAAETLEQGWLANLERLWQQLLDEALDQLAKDGTFKPDADAITKRIGSLLLDHELHVTEQASRTVPPAEYVRAAQAKRWPNDLARVRALWDVWRKTGKLPGKTEKDARAIKALYIRSIQTFWQKRGADFITGKPAAVGINEKGVIWNPDAFDRQGARKAIEHAAKVGRARARTIIETETTRYYNATRTNIYDQMEQVGGYLFICVRDHATTKWCRSRGIPPMVLLKGTPALRKNTPPCHWNCRSELLPLSTLNPSHRKLLEDTSRYPENRKLVPLPPGWNQAA